MKSFRVSGRRDEVLKLVHFVTSSIEKVLKFIVALRTKPPSDNTINRKSDTSKVTKRALSKLLLRPP